MEHIVHGCSNCPYNYNKSDGWDDGECRHPESNYHTLSDVPMFNDNYIPDWCPLKTESITISINSINQEIQ